MFIVFLKSRVGTAGARRFPLETGATTKTFPVLTAEQIESKAPKKINSSFEARDMANPKFQQKCFGHWS